MQLKHACVFAGIAFALASFNADSLEIDWHSSSYLFTYEGRRYTSEISSNAVVTAPSWSPNEPLPLSPGKAVETARKELRTLVARRFGMAVNVN